MLAIILLASGCVALSVVSTRSTDMDEGSDEDALSTAEVEGEGECIVLSAFADICQGAGVDENSSQFLACEGDETESPNELIEDGPFFHGSSAPDILDLADKHRFAYGEEGDDSIDASHREISLLEADGGAGSDTLKGSLSNDFLIGGIGSDFIVGSMGDDTIISGESNFDQIISKAPALDDGVGDTIIAGPGNDVVFLGSGDALETGSGADWVIAIPNEDYEAHETRLTVRDFSPQFDKIEIFVDAGQMVGQINYSYIGVKQEAFSNGVMLILPGGSEIFLEGLASEIPASCLRFTSL